MASCVSIPGSGRPTFNVCLISAFFAFFLLAGFGLLGIAKGLHRAPSLTCLICPQCQNTPMIRKLLVCFLFHLVLWNFKWNHILRQLGCLLSRTGRKGHFPFIASRNFFATCWYQISNSSNPFIWWNLNKRKENFNFNWSKVTDPKTSSLSRSNF